MKTRKYAITQSWLLEKLPLLNAKEIERRVGLKNGRLADIKRGKAKLHEWELVAIQSILEGIQL